MRFLIFLSLLLSLNTWANSPKSQTFCSENNSKACLRLESGKINQLFFLNPFNSPLVLSYQINCPQKQEKPYLYRDHILRKKGIHQLTTLDLNQDEIKKCSFKFSWQFGLINPEIKDYLYRLPYPEGEVKAVIQGYHGKLSHQPPHQYALDFDLKEGDLVVAARAGKVAQTISHYKECSLDPSYKDKANLVEIIHDDGTVGRYVHFGFNQVKVQKGDKVKEGQYLGYVSCTGYATQAHLHFEVVKPINGFVSQSIPVEFQTK
jgi:murein DD-endopeptidase MepM/ murein hydrolase activator NlpD